MQACTAWGTALAGLAVSMGTFAQPTAPMSLRSCVAGSPPLQVPATAEQATLDAADRLRFDAAAQARYPLYQRGGMRPYQVLLLRRGGQWLYVTLWQDGRAQPCFAAVFSADRFDFTGDWIAKYRPRPHDPTD